MVLPALLSQSTSINPNRNTSPLADESFGAYSNMTFLKSGSGTSWQESHVREDRRRQF